MHQMTRLALRDANVLLPSRLVRIKLQIVIMFGQDVHHIYIYTVQGDPGRWECTLF